jgi:hypothetical protein
LFALGSALEELPGSKSVEESFSVSPVLDLLVMIVSVTDLAFLMLEKVMRGFYALVGLVC